MVEHKVREILTENMRSRVELRAYDASTPDFGPNAGF